LILYYIIVSTVILDLKEELIVNISEMLFENEIVSRHMNRHILSIWESISISTRLLTRDVSVIRTASHYAVALGTSAKILYLPIDRRVRAALFG